MGAYGALRPVGITRDDGVIDRLMRPAGDELLTGRAQGRAPLLGQPGRDGLMDRGEDRIARNDRQHIVESDVGALEGVEIVERLEIGGESALELFEVFGGRVLSRIARQADLEEGACLLEVPHAIGRRQQMPRRPGQRFEDDLGGRLRHARALAVADGHQPHFLQREQRLAHRRPADSELLHQIALRRQLVAGRVLALLDHRLEAARDLFIESTTPDGADLCWYTCHTSQVKRAAGRRSRPIRRAEVGADWW